MLRFPTTHRLPFRLFGTRVLRPCGNITICVPMSCCCLLLAFELRAVGFEGVHVLATGTGWILYFFGRPENPYILSP